jgi:hypothetical protein
LQQSLALYTGVRREASTCDADRSGAGSSQRARIRDADGDRAVELAGDRSLLASASPEDRAQLIRKLGTSGWVMGAIVGTERCLAAFDVLATCRSAAEYQRVLAYLGGAERLLSMLHDTAVRNAVLRLHASWTGGR